MRLDLVNRVSLDAEMHVVAIASIVPQRRSVTVQQQFRDVLRETGFSSGDNFMIIQRKLLPLTLSSCHGFPFSSFHSMSLTSVQPLENCEMLPAAPLGVEDGNKGTSVNAVSVLCRQCRLGTTA